MLKCRKFSSKTLWNEFLVGTSKYYNLRDSNLSNSLHNSFDQRSLTRGIPKDLVAPELL
jgi:hypothetical protein